jgi:hypothetical protein
MKAWFITLIGASTLAAVTPAIANVTITGMRTAVTPLPSLNLSQDLRQIAYASARPVPLKFPRPVQQTGEIVLPGAFNVSDPRRLDGTLMDPGMMIPCTTWFFSQCGGDSDFREMAAYTGPGTAALRFNLGPNVDLETFLKDRLDMKRIQRDVYGGGLDEFESFAPSAL